jgi:hypothetical protein
MKFQSTLISILFLALLVQSCTTTRFVKPLKEKEQAIQISLGGPMVNIPNIGSIPLPITNITYGKGVSENVTGFGSIYPSAAIFGVFQVDAGFVFKWNKQENWGITTTPMLNFAVDSWEWNAKLWPNADVNFYWEKPFKNKTDKHWMVYGGFNNWFELSKLRAHNVVQPKHWIVSPHTGFVYSTKKWNYTLEYKLIAPGADNVNLVTSYSSLAGNTGANSLLLTLCRKF